jgi:hypothetical protein
MKALLWKDLRIYRGAIVAAILAICLPYVVGTAMAMSSPGNLTEIYGYASGVGLVAATLVAAVFGGCAFAIERRERWGEFLAMMPVSRRSMVLSKIGISLTALFAMWIAHASINFVMQSGGFGRVRFLGGSNFVARPNILGIVATPLSSQDFFYQAYVVSGAGIVLAFGLSWLMSIFLESPSIAASVGLAVVMSLFLNIETNEEHPAVYLLVAVAFGLGFFSFFLGTILYLESVSP